MNVAVLTLTRDRFAYTQHCFASLRENAGIEYDHHVFDNGSTDGTREWLQDEYEAGRIEVFGSSTENLGIYPALNRMLDQTAGRYDVTVNFDNDCELLAADTLRVICELAVAHPGNVIGPLVQGLRKPPAVIGETWLRGMRVGVTQRIGGILMPIPDGWRYPEGGAYIHADGLVCAAALAAGHTVGQLLDYPVNHYETTDGQHARYPAYFERRRAEGIPD